jgi:hypothetical protein
VGEAGDVSSILARVPRVVAAIVCAVSGLSNPIALGPPSDDDS